MEVIMMRIVELESCLLWMVWTCARRGSRNWVKCALLIAHYSCESGDECYCTRWRYKLCEMDKNDGDHDSRLHFFIHTQILFCTRSSFRSGTWFHCLLRKKMRKCIELCFFFRGAPTWKPWEKKNMMRFATDDDCDEKKNCYYFFCIQERRREVYL